MTGQRSENDVPVVLVLAAAENGVIGRGDALPWELPDDLQHFKRTTIGRPIIMGRKTFESVGFPLPGRRNIVITRDDSWQHDGVLTCHTLDAALERAFEQALIDGADAAMIVGGAEIYRLALPRADKVVLTLHTGQHHFIGSGQCQTINFGATYYHCGVCAINQRLFKRPLQGLF